MSKIRIPLRFSGVIEVNVPDGTSRKVAFAAAKMKALAQCQVKAFPKEECDNVFDDFAEIVGDEDKAGSIWDKTKILGVTGTFKAGASSDNKLLAYGVLCFDSRFFVAARNKIEADSIFKTFLTMSHAFANLGPKDFKRARRFDAIVDELKRKTALTFEEAQECINRKRKR